MRPTCLEVAAALDPHRNFLAYGGATFCNVFLCAFMGIRGRTIPLVSANALFAWFDTPDAKGRGWIRVDAAEALALAKADCDVVAVLYEEPHGHVGAVVESLPNTPGRLCVSAAGAENFVRAPIERSFGRHQPTFYANTTNPEE